MTCQTTSATKKVVAEAATTMTPTEMDEEEKGKETQKEIMTTDAMARKNPTTAACPSLKEAART